MCGIAGAINHHQYNLEAVRASLFHRGPNEQELFMDGDVTLVHTRLSIQDIALGHQLFHFQHYTIVFNGEIYNHLELRDDLKDINFKTLSDTETLLHLYVKYKEKMFEKIDGMFAFAILDKQRNKLFLARDRSGKKPLYIYKDLKSLLFASELNAIKAGVSSLEINEDAISSYLRSGFFLKNLLLTKMYKMYYPVIIMR